MKRLPWLIDWRVILVVPLLAALDGCAPMARLPDPVPTFAEAPATIGPLVPLAEVLQGRMTGADPSSFRLLHDNQDALRVRLALTDLAQQALDIQYFIWEDDATGHLLMQHVIAAADRGVRVRLLLDDLTLAGLDKELAALDAHPSIEVRLYNPWTVRPGLLRPLQFAVESARLNHRMHNKVYMADGRFAIVGGRNIGDRYFGVSLPFVQNDMDVVVAGAVIRDVANSFDLYWNSAMTVPIYWTEANPEELLTRLRRRLARSNASHEKLLSVFDTPERGWSSYLSRFLETASSGEAHVWVDSPNLPHHAPSRMYTELTHFISRAQHEVLLSSPYLIPDQAIVDEFQALVDQGVKVRLVTNSLASNSHVIAHTGYKKWRRALLRAGVELYEMRPVPKILDRFFSAVVEPEKLALHTKAIVVDGRWTFIGSPNLDPRSLVINKEVGLAIDDPVLAKRAAAILERDMLPGNAWRVTLDEDGWLHWRRGAQELDRQPASGFMQRFEEFFLNLLPIKNQT